MELLLEIKEAVRRGKQKTVVELVAKAIDEGVEPKVILEEGMLPAMSEIGELFAQNKIFVPEVLIAARAMNAGSEVLKPHMKSGDVSAKGRVVIGTVKGDQHDIGKNLVKMMMEGQGLEVIDLGVNVHPKKFVDTAIEKEADIIACSALLTTTMPMMAAVVKEREAAGITDSVKVMIGGAPVTQAFCEKIGADKYTPDAATAAQEAVKLCERV